MAKPDIRAVRKHHLLARREKQLLYNILAYHGGGDYINARLTRFPCEANASWSGTQTGSVLKESKWSAGWNAGAPSGVIGRRDRAYLINYANRIVSKIGQFVFGQDIKRDGIDPAFARDATRTGLSITSFMEEVSAIETTGQWCWIGADRRAPAKDPATGKPMPRSVARKEAEGDRVWWSLWYPSEVVDWHFDDTGALSWLITEEDVLENADYATDPVTRKIRTIRYPGGGVRLTLDDKDPTKIVGEEAYTISAPIVPFILVGVPSDRPHWFDDVERVQASLLNLESAHNENLIQAVFPQLIMPQSVLNDIMTRCELNGVDGYVSALEMLRGLQYPILEPVEASGLTRYLTPNANDLAAIPSEILRRRKELMQIVGLAMQNNEGSQVQSAASKSWDNLDPANTLRKRAISMEETERKAVAISKQLDTTFLVYDPQYPRQFDVLDFERDVVGLVNLGNVDGLPASARKEIARAAVKALSQIVSIPADRYAAILDEIDSSSEADVDFAAISERLRSRADSTVPGSGPGKKPDEENA